MRFLISADQVLAVVKCLPALPKVVQELDLALRSESTSTERIVKLVSSDSALTATALKLANSSFYGVGGRAVSLRDAVQILGMQTLSAAVMTAAVTACFDPGACEGYDFEGSWRHALSTAVCAQMLAETRGVDPCTAYTAGLLHDLGSLVLATHFPRPYEAALAWSAEHDVVPMEAEHAVLGIDHASVGGLVAAHWKFSPTVVRAIRLHHEVPAHDSGGLLDVLHLADNITHALDLSRSADDMVPPLSLSTWERIAPSPDELQRVFGRIEARLESLDIGIFA